MKLLRTGMVILFTAAFLFCGYACQSDPDLLSPYQVDSSMLDQVVKVKGKITYAVENPGGQGGMYMTMGNSKGEVDVRIQRDLWDSYDESEKAIYKEGRTVIVEGILFRAGAVLVVVHGKYETTSNTTSPTF